MTCSKVVLPEENHFCYLTFMSRMSELGNIYLLLRSAAASAAISAAIDAVGAADALNAVLLCLMDIQAG